MGTTAAAPFTAPNLAAGIAPAAQPAGVGCHRKMGWVLPNQIVCPNGHHVKRDTIVLSHAGVICKYSMDPITKGPVARGRPSVQCGAWLYIVAGASFASRDLPTLLFVAEVTYGELQLMESRRFDLAATLEFLGATFPVRAQGAPVRNPQPR